MMGLGLSFAYPVAATGAMPGFGAVIAIIAIIVAAIVAKRRHRQYREQDL